MKKTLSLMLALAMVFALVLVVAPAAEAATPCEHSSHDGWTAWSTTENPIQTLDADGNKGLAGGKYYLTEDVTVTHCLKVKADEEVTICLNGHKLTGNPSDKDGNPVGIGFLDPFSGSTGVTKLNICDCSATKTGVVERTTLPEAGRFGAMALARKNVEINIYGGTWKLTVENKASSPSMIQTNNKTAVINIYEDAKFEQVNGMTVKITGTLNVYGVAADMTVMPSGADFKVFVDKAEQTTYVKDQTYTVKAFAPTPAPAPGGSTNPGTGDSANLVVMGLGLVLGVAGMACLLPKKQTV